MNDASRRHLVDLWRFHLRAAAVVTCLLVLVAVTHMVCRYLAQNMHGDWAAFISTLLFLGLLAFAFSPLHLLIFADIAIAISGQADLRRQFFGGTITGWYSKSVLLIVTVQHITLVRTILISPHIIIDDEVTSAILVASIAYVSYKALQGELRKYFEGSIVIWGCIFIVYLLAVMSWPGLNADIYQHEVNTWLKRQAIAGVTVPEERMREFEVEFVRRALRIR